VDGEEDRGKGDGKETTKMEKGGEMGYIQVELRWIACH